MIPPVIIRTSVQEEDGFYCQGVTIKGRMHQAEEMPCQDYHRYDDLGYGWRAFIVSDGAGSAAKSGEGALFVCERAKQYLRQLVEKRGWIENHCFPSEVEWHIECRAIFSQIKLDLRQWLSSGGDGNESDYSATLLVAITTPISVMVGHIGDGRIGCRLTDGTWISLMTPHKGPEPSQTIFVQSNWTYPQTPALRLNGVPVPETRVCYKAIDAIVLVSDGCENFSWECDVFNESDKRIESVNIPFAGFLNPLLAALDESPLLERNDCLSSIIQDGNELCKEETDDKTILIGRFINVDSLHPLVENNGILGDNQQG